jgi:hypothetical protein
MKKHILLAAIVLVCIAIAVPAFAFGPTTLSGPIGTTPAVSTVIGSATYTPSTNVAVNACATPNNYAVAATHNLSLGATGGRAFGATTASGIQWQDVSASGTAAGTCSGTGTLTTDAAPTLTGTWSAL